MNEPGRVAAVTGAARGIGAAIAVRLAEEGCDVAVIDVDGASCAATVAAVESTGRRALAVGADVTDEAAVEAGIARVASVLGPPLVLVNNAGVIRETPIHRMGLDEWRLLIDVNVTGTFLVTRAVQGYMSEARWGRIVNLSSTAALGERGLAHYSTAKAGLQGFTRSLARELGRFGVTVNAVAPGFTVTEMTRAVAQRVGIAFEDMVKLEVAKIPVGRPGAPEDVAQAVAYFADERSGFVSGQVLYVAGGPAG